MPIFEYRCLDCGRDFEDLVSSSREENTACPECKSSSVEKKLSTFAASVPSGSIPPCATGSCNTGSCCANGACGIG